MAEDIEIVEFWCRDCGGDDRFEVVSGGAAGVAREWACITCGDAYIEAFDVATEIEVGVRGVA